MRLCLEEMFVRCGHIQRAIAMSMCEIGTLYRTEGVTVGSNTLSTLVGARRHRNPRRNFLAGKPTFRLMFNTLPNDA